MGGHSHWAGIKHKKGIKDAKRGKIFTKLIREITIAAKIGGGDLEGNARLRKAVDDARAANMPADNVKRAIMKGTGQIPGASYEELTYEGYGPAGIAVMVEVTTDNKNRTSSEVRKIFESHGGSMGSAGCVAWMFSQCGYMTVKKTDAKEDELMSIALDAGAEDFKSAEEEDFEIITAVKDFDAVKAKLKEKNVPVSSSEITMLPKSEVNVEADKAPQVVSLMDALEEHDDVKNVYSNFNIPDSILAKLES